MYSADAPGTGLEVRHNRFTVRIPFKVMDKIEPELCIWLDDNTTWGEMGLSNYIIRFKYEKELTAFLLKWSDYVEK